MPGEEMARRMRAQCADTAAEDRHIISSANAAQANIWIYFLGSFPARARFDVFKESNSVFLSEHLIAASQPTTNCYIDSL
jgi:hypothetical protein